MSELKPFERGEVTTIFPYIWRVKTKFPERFGKPCRVLARGKMNSCEVEFEDGFRAITSRNYLRRRSNQGTTLVPDNGITLCKACHDKVHGRVK